MRASLCNPNLMIQTLKIGSYLKPWPFSLSSGEDLVLGSLEPLCQHTIFQYLLLSWVCWRASKRTGLHCIKPSTTMLGPEKGLQEIRLSSDLIKPRPNMSQCISDLTDIHIKPHWCIVWRTQSHTRVAQQQQDKWLGPGSPLLSSCFCNHKLLQNFCTELRAFAVFRCNLFIHWVSCHTYMQSLFYHRLKYLFPSHDFFCGVSRYSETSGWSAFALDGAC